MFLGIDVGTTGIKGLVVDRNGNVLNGYTHPLELSIPYAGWAEQNPEDWFDGVIAILKRVAEDYRIDGIGFSGQMHSLVCLDKEGKILRNAILWCDQRTTVQCREATEKMGGEEAVIEAISNPILEGFTLGKILWIKENEPEIYREIDKIMLPKDYICMKLGGSFGIDYSDASGTALFDVSEGLWNLNIIETLEIDEKILPPVFDSHAKRGLLKEELTRQFGWKETYLVSGGADNAVAAYGIGIAKPGDTMVSIGTSGTVLTATEETEPDFVGGVHLFRHVIPSQRYYMGVMLSAAHSLNWAIKNFGITDDFTILEGQIKTVNPGSDGLLFLPYLNGERTPHRDPDARAVLFGISSKTTRAEIARAVIEGVTFGLRDSFELIKTKTKITNIRIVGGGAKNRTWCTILADNFKLPVSIPENDEGGAYGAAMLAAKADGISDEEIASWISLKETIEPNPENYARYDVIYEQFKGLYRDLKERFKTVSQLP
ncbi:MAG TPA: xylulokinase [Thermotogota bacterium]|nr:xylulokinase [Thermotogota bacterium]HPJ87805.1 xylulokinase [Thermotogota bacterium]HPR95197.1 xylulokinase [Thermotogota bacterium]